jgi:hypothetical protein
MKLKSAARYYDDTPVADGYTGDYLWRCQFSSFNDVNAVGSTSTRRILSIAPDLQLPARRVVKVFDDRWLVGDGNPDSWRGEVIRQSFNMKKATALAQMLTPAQACLSQAGTEAYTQAIYFKDTVNSLNNADYDPFWNYFFAPTEPVGKGSFIRDGTRLLRVRSSYVPLEDLRICQSDEIDMLPQAAVFGTGAYDPASDSFGAGTVATPVILFDTVKAYTNVTQATASVAKGDLSGLVAASAVTPAVGKTVDIAGTAWRILGSTADLDAWLLHLRRA